MSRVFPAELVQVIEGKPPLQVISIRVRPLVWQSAAALLALLLPTSTAPAQQKNNNAATIRVPLLTRTATRHQAQHLGYGGTVTVIGAPQGSITIEGWAQNEVDVTAEIKLQADTEEELNRLAALNSFVFDEDMNHVRILTTGTHDKAFMRRVAKDFPKKLLGLPWKIDYRIRVPVSTDLEIDAGGGPINLTGVEGAIRITATQSEMKLTLNGGSVAATVASGKVFVSIPVRSWRGRGVEIQVAAGELTVELPPGFNGDIDADVLRSGQIEDSYGALASRERPGITARQMKARAGAGGAFFRFTVGDGTLQIKKAVTGDK